MVAFDHHCLCAVLRRRGRLRGRHILHEQHRRCESTNLLQCVLVGDAERNAFTTDIVAWPELPDGDVQYRCVLVQLVCLMTLNCAACSAGTFATGSASSCTSVLVLLMPTNVCRLLKHMFVLFRDNWRVRRLQSRILLHGKHHMHR